MVPLAYAPKSQISGTHMPNAVSPSTSLEILHGFFMIGLFHFKNQYAILITPIIIGLFYLLEG